MYANALPPLDFVTAVKNCLSNYVTLEGRARRSEYWWFVLPVYIMDFLFFLLEILYASGALKSMIIQVHPLHLHIIHIIHMIHIHLLIIALIKILEPLLPWQYLSFSFPVA